MQVYQAFVITLKRQFSPKLGELISGRSLGQTSHLINCWKQNSENRIVLRRYINK